MIKKHWVQSKEGILFLIYFVGQIIAFCTPFPVGLITHFCDYLMEISFFLYSVYLYYRAVNIIIPKDILLMKH
jgi:hypothetical protein